MDSLLTELGAPSLPRVQAVVHSHHAATEREGVRDGVFISGRWLPFQGGHYRLPSLGGSLKEGPEVSPEGEIHLGPGWRLQTHGTLAESAGRAYRANASHNAGILYHEYGHHINRHTADFRANRLLPKEQQDNRKTALDEGTADYWAASMLGSPHIWAWHHRHEAGLVHPRSLTSAKTMADYRQHGAEADAHENGTIWASALWDLRGQWEEGLRSMDLLVLQALLLLGQAPVQGEATSVESLRRARKKFPAGLAALLEADRRRHAGRHEAQILSVFAARGIRLEKAAQQELLGSSR